MKSILLTLVCIVFFYTAYGQLSVVASNDTSICLGDSTSLNAVPANGTPPYSYSWTPVAGLSCTTCQSPSASPLLTTTYVITVTDAMMSVVTDSVQVTVNSINIAVSSNRDTICAGDTTQLFTQTNPSSCGLNVTGCSGIISQVDVGTGALSTDIPSPYYGFYEDVRWQSLYTKADLQGAGLSGGTITKISFNIAVLNSTQAYQNFTIKMGCTASPDLSGGAWLTGLSTVYYVDSFTTTLGWNTHILDTPFDWDGNSNLVLEFCFDNTSWTDDDEVFFETTSYVSSLFDFADGDNGCILPTPGLYSSRPNTRFEICNDSLASVIWTPALGLTNPTIFNPIATVASTTTYTSTITDGTGCSNIDSVTVATQALNLSLGNDTSLCAGDSIQLNAAINLQGAAITWSPAAGLSCTTCANPKASPTTSTIYYVNATSGACVDADTISVVVNALPNTNAGNDTAICIIDSLQLNATGGATFSWAPVSGLSNPLIANPMANPSTSTTYVVTGLSVFGCMQSDTITIQVNGPESISISSARDTICPGDTTQLMVDTCIAVMDDFDPGIDMSNWSNITGGVAGLSCGSISGNALYFNSTGTRSATTNGISVNSSSTVSFSILIGSGAAPCENADGGEDVVLEYSINGGANWIIISTYSEAIYTTWTNVVENVPTGAQTGSTMFRWRQLSNSGLNFDNWSIDNVEFTCSGGSGPLTYNWSPAGSLNNATILNPIATVATTTTYTVTVTDSNGCSNVDSVTIVIQILDVVTGGDTSICNGDSIQMNTTSNIDGTLYNWSPVTGLSCTTCPNPMVSPDTTTTYYVSGSISICNDVDSITITVNPNPVPYAGNDTFLCINDSIQLNGTGGVNYYWAPSAGLSDDSISNPFAKPLITTTYSLTVVSDSGCSAIDTLEIIVNGPPAVVATSIRDTICAGDTTQLNVNTCGSITDDFDPAIDMSAWSNISGGTVSTNCGSITGNALYFNSAGLRSSTTNGLNIASGGNISFSLVIGNGAAPCENADGGEDVALQYSTNGGALWVNINIYNEAAYITWTNIVEPIPAGAQTASTMFRWMQLGNSGINFDNWAIDNVDITCSGSSSAYTYSWTPAGGLTNATIADPIATVASTTTYMVMVSDSTGCNNQDSVTVATAPLVITTIPDSTICEGDSVLLTTSSNLNGVSYSWTPTTGLSCTTCESPMAKPTSITAYTVNGSSGACADAAIINITVNPLPVGGAGNDTMLCINDSVQLNATGGATYLWNPGIWLTNPNIANPIAFPTSTITYVATITTALGCSITDSLTVTVNFVPILNPTSDRGTICPNDTTLLRANNSTAGIYAFSWSPPGGLSDPNSENTIATVATQTTYTVFADGGGACVSTDSVVVNTANLSINSVADTTMCANESYVLTTSANLSGTNFSWNPTTTLSCALCPNPIATPSTSTTYYVTGTSGACTDIDTIIVSINAVPLANAGSDDTICKGESAQMNATGGTSYVWVPSDGLSSTTISNPTATPTATTFYNVEVTSAAGCKASDEVMVHIGLNEMSIMSSEDTICRGDSVKLDIVTCDIPYDHFNNGINYSKWTTTLGGVAGSGCGSITGDALYFDGPGVRQAVTNKLSLSLGVSVNFYLKYGTGITSCERVDSGKVVVFEYSINNGGTWKNINTYKLADFQTFKRVNEFIPKGAQVPNTLFRWKQQFHDGPGNDNWAIDDITFCDNQISNVITYSWLPPTGLSDPNIARPYAKPEQTTTYVLTVVDSNCTRSDTVTVFVDTCIVNTGQFASKQFGIEVFPNPADGKFNILVSMETMDDVSIIITDLLGEVMYVNEQHGQSAQFEITSNRFAAGLYFIRIKVGDSNYFRKILIQK